MTYIEFVVGKRIGVRVLMKCMYILVGLVDGGGGREGVLRCTEKENVP